jgi:hypothetical protein
LHVLPLGAGCFNTFIIGLQFTSFPLTTENTYKMENKKMTNRRIQSEELQEQYALTFITFVKRTGYLLLLRFTEI